MNANTNTLAVTNAANRLVRLAARPDLRDSTKIREAQSFASVANLATGLELGQILRVAQGVLRAAANKANAA